MMLRLEDVSRHVAGRALISDVTLSVPAGVMLAIVGPNGAGKSTLLRLASGLVAPDRGRVVLDGQPLATMTPQRLAACRAMLAQDSPLRTRMAVLDLVRMGMRDIAAAQAQALATEMLRRVGLAGFEHRDVLELSGGERQRAHLARVLAQLEAGMAAGGGRPGLLLLDEPLSAQDLSRQTLVMRIARAHVRRGGACVVVLHDLNWAAACADVIAVLRRGRLQALGPPSHVLTCAVLGEAFEIAAPRIHRHDRTKRPFVVPHDLQGA